MLKKLLKYDMKNMLRVLVYIYVVSVGLACITRLINIGKEIQAVAILGSVFAGITYSAVASILINTFVHILRIFITSFYKDESYLTHTLPVKKSKLLLSKFLASLIVVFSSVAVSFLCLFIVLYSKGFIQTLSALIDLAVMNFNMPSWLFITLFVLNIFAQICAMISMSFAAVVKANTYNQKRVLYGLLWFLAFYFATSMATVLISSIAFAVSGNFSDLIASQLSQGAFISILVIGLMVYVGAALLFYLISYKMLKKGVNVD